MSTGSFAEIEGIGMDEAGVEAFLREQGIGVSSLASDGEAYGVPVSFGYDGPIGSTSSSSGSARRAERRSSRRRPSGRVSPFTTWNRNVSGGA